MNWSTTWKASKKPSKQRAYVREAPQHIRSTLLGSHLSKELRQKHTSRSVRVRKGDKVKVMTGQHKGKTGTVDRVDTIRKKIFITGVEFQRRDGSKAMYPVHPSNLLVTELFPDKRRMAEAKGAQK